MFYYFAYGSNMLIERIRDRCPSARPIGVASVNGYKLVFHKKSDDGSGKADIVKCHDESSVVFGVVYEIDGGEGDSLDKAEGYEKGSKKHYNREDNFEVILNEEKINTRVYFAQKASIDENCKAYDWYRDLVIAGAKQNNLPKDYIKKISENIEIAEYPDAFGIMAERKKTAKEVLEAAGYKKMIENWQSI